MPGFVGMKPEQVEQVSKEIDAEAQKLEIAKLRPRVPERPDRHRIGNIRRSAVRALVALGAVLIIAMGATTTATAAPAGSHLQFAHSGKCITVPRWSTTVGQPLDQFTCVVPSQANQQWIFYPVPGHPGWNLIQSASSTQCMDIDGRSTAAGALVIQSPCKYDDSAQLFKAEFSGRSSPFRYYLFRNGHSNMCLNVSGRSTANGASIIQWPCSSAFNNEQIRIWTY